MVIAMNYFDIALLLIVFLITFISAHKGLFYVLSQFIASVGALILAKLLSNPLAAVIYSRFLESGITEKLAQILPEGSVSGELQKIADSTLHALPAFVQKLAGQFRLTDLLHAGAGTSEMLSVEQIQTDYIAPLVTKAVSALCMIALFAVLSLFLKGVALWLNRTFFEKRDGAISKFNKFTGAVFGTLRGALAVFILAMLLNLAASFIQNPTFQNLVETSYICNYFSTWI